MEECSQGTSEGFKRQTPKNNNRLAIQAAAQASWQRPCTTRHPKNGKGMFSLLVNEILSQARLNETQAKFLETHGSNNEKAIANGGKLGTGDIYNYVKSFGVIPSCWRRRGKRKSIHPTLENDFGANSEAVVALWEKPNSPTSPLVLMPIHLKTHFAGTVVAVKKRTLFAYDSKKTYDTRSKGKVKAATNSVDKKISGKAEKTAEGAQNDTVEYMNTLALDKDRNLVLKGEKEDGTLETKPVCTAPLASKLHGIHQTIVKIEEKTNSNAYMQIKDARGWRLHMVQSFVHQNDDKSCGVFQCLFFDCVANEIPMQTGRRALEKRHLQDYRKWIAYSLAVTRIMCFAPTQNRGKETGEIISLDMTND
jgi:hypothetical protein